MTAMRRDAQGYSLVELLIVVAILAIVCAIAIPSYTEMVHKAKVVSAMGDIRHFQYAIEFYFAETGVYPDSLSAVNPEGRKDPWGEPYVYTVIAGAGNRILGSCRKDKNLVPINSDYDLYSKGRDKASKPPLSAQSSKDDVVRANNGGFIGIATNY